MDLILNQIKDKIEKNNFYDLEIYLNNKLFRLNNKKNYTDMNKILIYLFENIQNTELEQYQNFIIKLNEYYLNCVTLIEDYKISEDELKLIFNLNNKIKICIESVIFFNKINSHFFNSKNMKILNFLINESIKHKEFGLGQKVLLGLEFNLINKILYKKFFNEWFNNVDKSEIDLLITRYILFLLIKKDINSTLMFYNNYKDLEEFKNSDLEKFCNFLINILIKKNLNDFNLLRDKFCNNLLRDINYESYIKKIKGIYFESEGGLFSMINSFFKS